MVLTTVAGRGAYQVLIGLLAASNFSNLPLLMVDGLFV